MRQIVAVVLACWCCAGVADELTTARAALHDKLYPLAQTHAERALAAGKPPAQALPILLEALRGQGRYAEILERLEHVDAATRETLTDGALAYWRAAAYLHTGRPLDAARTAEAAVSTESPYADALRRTAARARRAADDLEGALKLFAEVDRGSTNVQTRAENALEWAGALDQAGRADAALEVLKMQADLGAAAGHAVYDGALLRGRILMRQGRSAEATMVLNQLAMNERATETARVQALVEMSVFTFDSGKTNEAVAYACSAYERAKAPETRRLAGFHLADLLCGSTNTIDEGESLVKTLVREFPDHPASMRAHLKLADALLQAQRAERAAAEYRIFLETYPSSSHDADVLQGRGWALMQLGRYTEAGGAFQRAAQQVSDPDVKAECLFKQGDALLAEERYKEAAQVYAALAHDFPHSALADRALYQSADVLQRAKLDNEARERYQLVAETYPDRAVAPQALLSLAAMQTEAGDIDDAVRTYKSVLDTYTQQPVRADAWMGRGKAHYRTYRFEAAMQDFAAVAENAPERRDEARFMMTLCLYGLGRDQEARAAAASFLLDFPESPRFPDMLLWLGKFDFNRGRYAEARRIFINYSDRWPTSRWADAALVWAARAAFAANDFTGTIELVTRMVRAHPQSTRLPEALLVQADALMELARYDEAVLLLDQVITQSAESEWARLALLRKGDALFAMGAGNSARYREALMAYRQMLTQNNLTPSLMLQLQFKAGRCLEKLKQIDEAIDQYYTEVIVRFLNERTRGTWFDERSTGLFVRAGFTVAELYEQKGHSDQAIRVLQRVAQSGVPGADEARQRIERLRGKRTGGA